VHEGLEKKVIHRDKQRAAGLGSPSAGRRFRAMAFCCWKWRVWEEACHALTLAVIFQPLVARWGTTERLLFNNTNVYGLRLFQHEPT